MIPPHVAPPFFAHPDPPSTELSSHRRSEPLSCPSAPEHTSPLYSATNFFCCRRQTWRLSPRSLQPSPSARGSRPAPGRSTVGLDCYDSYLSAHPLVSFQCSHVSGGFSASQAWVAAAVTLLPSACEPQRSPSRESGCRAGALTRTPRPRLPCWSACEAATSSVLLDLPVSHCDYLPFDPCWGFVGQLAFSVGRSEADGWPC